MYSKIFLILCLLSLVLAKKRLVTKHLLSKKNHKQDEGGSLVNGLSNAKLVGTCMSGLMASIPPEFCWKEGADAGVIPTGCPAGYFRSLALCYQHCGSGYRHVLGVCWADCAGGYADHGLTCYKHFFSWYFKHSYIPGSLTNFDSRVPCPNGMYRSGALCYRDCNKIGMDNCGIGACSADGASCGSAIGQMALDVFSGIADAIAFVVSFGGSSAISAAKNSAKQALKKIGKEALQATLNNMKKTLTGKFRDVLKKEALKKALKNVKDQVKDIAISNVQGIAIEAFCNTVYESAIEKTLSTNSISEDTVISAVDIFGVTGIVDGCKDTSSSNGAVACAAGVLGTLSTFDPTGLLTIATTFMKPTCAVPAGRRHFHHFWEAQDYSHKNPDEQPPTNETVETAFNLTETVKDDCIVLYDECLFKGNNKTICENTPNLGEFEHKTKSLITGKNATGVIFQLADYQGAQFPFQRSQVIDCFDAFDTEEFKFSDMIGSINFEVDSCLVINYATNTEGEGEISSDILLCKTEETTDYQIPEQLTELSLNLPQPAKITLYSEPNFQGQSLEITQDNLSSYSVENPLGFNSIRSVKYE